MDLLLNCQRKLLNLILTVDFRLLFPLLEEFFLFFIIEILNEDGVVVVSLPILGGSLVSHDVVISLNFLVVVL